MLLAHKKLPVIISKFFKSILPKNTAEEANFESIITNITDDQIVYQLHGSIDIITFCKKANLNVYDRIQSTQGYILQERLKVNIIPKHVVYVYKGHDFNVYLADEFIFIVYSKNYEKDKSAWTWYIVIYDTKLNILTQHSASFDKSSAGIYGFYYLKKYRKAICPIGNPIFTDKVFHKNQDTRRGFNLSGFWIIHLNNPINNEYTRSLIYISSDIEQYIKNKYPDKCDHILITFIDYSIDINKGVIYMVCRITCHMKYKSYVLVLGYNLCSEGDITSFEIEVPTPIIEVPTFTSEETVSDENILLYLSSKLLYLSSKRLRDKGMPKYLPMHISSEFYDFMSNKLFQSDMIFSSHSKTLVRDRHFNRMDSVLAKIESLKVAAHIPLQEDIITMRNGRNNDLLAVLLMNDADCLTVSG